ncbi:MAG: TetR/AcrR family transcriptional regulator [Stappiaceae bacterium]
MAEHTATAEKILDVAERMARTGGYNGFSFREIAKEVGIKSASVHYHFPGKEDLGAAVARRYSEKFLGALGDAGDLSRSPEQLYQLYIQTYRHALQDERLMCLCGVLGSEIAYLPHVVSTEVRQFFTDNIEWLKVLFSRAFEKEPAEKHEAAALRLIASLEGAMILAQTLGDVSVFDKAADAMPLSV